MSPQPDVLPPGLLFTGRYTNANHEEVDGFKSISGSTHARMHQALALAAQARYRAIPCEVCGALSGSIGPIDTREVAGLLADMAADAPDDADDWERPIPPHRRHLYPDIPRWWQSMTFATLDVDDTNGVAVDVAQEWAASPGGVLCFYGPTGAGKTHLVSSITQAMQAQGIDVSAWEFDDWHDTLRGVFDSGREEIEAFRRRMERAAVLVWDDIRAEPIGTGAREMLEKIIHVRTHDGRPILLSTNASEEAWQTWNARAYSRLKANAYSTWVPIVGVDRRLQA